MSLRAKDFPWICIKTGYIFDPRKTFSCPWVFSSGLESSWTVVNLFLIALLITLIIQESGLNNVIEQN